MATDSGGLRTALDAEIAAEPSAVEATAPADAPASGSVHRLLAFATANIRRRPERTVLAVAGIALAISAAVVMRTIAAGYQVVGVDAVGDAIGDAPYWVVPGGGIEVDAATGVIVALAPPPAVTAPSGWTADTTLTARLPDHADVALIGRADVPAGTARISREAARRLGLADGNPLTLAGRPLAVQPADGAGAQVEVPLEVAAAAGATDGWVTLRAPPGDPGAPEAVATATGLEVTSDPSVKAPAGGPGLVYSTQRSTDRLGFLSFQQRFAAELGAKVSSSVLGLISTVAIVLGFVIAVSSFVASVQERRREFGIMASIGLTDEVLYFFLVESLLLFVAAYLAGIVLGGAIVAVAAPGFFSLRAWAEGAGLVAMYLPALGIVAALVPVHRLLQQRPVSLLADH